MSTAPWLTETIRISAFGEPPKYGSSLLLDLFGVQPDHVNERPGQSFRQEAARHGRLRMILSRNPGRLDLVFADLADANTSDPTRSDYKPFFEIGDYDDVLPSIRPHIERFVRNLESPTRLAYAPTLFAPAQSLQEANRLIAAKLPHVHFDPDLDSDVFWQINRPRTSAISKLRLNRISKWHTVLTQLFQLVPSIPRLMPNREAVTAARVEIDINTPGDQVQTLHADDIASIMDELVSLARDLIEQGDIP
jgi:hypothetical protein